MKLEPDLLFKRKPKLNLARLNYRLDLELNITSAVLTPSVPKYKYLLTSAIHV